MEWLRNTWNAFVKNVVEGFYTALHYVTRHLLTIGDALSQVANVVLFFGDNANESVSGRAWRLHNKYRFWGIIKIVIDWCASPVEQDHCEASHKADVARAARLLRNQGR
jgi:hypothetical protein